MTQTTITWRHLNFFTSQEWANIQKTLKETNNLIPAKKDIFRPLIETPFNRVKVVILGHEPASMRPTDGLAYSFPKTVSGPTEESFAPGVLQTIFEEYEHDLGYSYPKTGNLLRWAKQGVLLWNETPTTVRARPRAHFNIGWVKLTLEILETLYLVNPDTVFILWTPNRDKWIDVLPEKAKIVDTGVPSLVNNSDFWGSSPFTKANAMLEAAGKAPINWRLP